MYQEKKEKIENFKETHEKDLKVMRDIKERLSATYLQTNYPAIYQRADLEKELNKPRKQHALNYTKPLEPFFRRRLPLTSRIVPVEI
ncbi:MAG: hypothetical protein EOM62_22080 [Bacteroidia bacterium]|nr:hypothetical protein [Bacteroidia bacterium]